MDNRRIKLKVLDYIYDIVGHSEVRDANEKKLRATILNKLPQKVPSYLSNEIETCANASDGNYFSRFLFSVGILSAPSQTVEEESFLYLKNKAELQYPGRTVFN